MKNKLQWVLLRFVLPAAGLYTLLSLALALPMSVRGLSRERIWLLFLLSVGAAAANLLFYIPKMPLYFKIATHFLCYVGLVLAALYFTETMQTGRWVVVLAAFILAYLLVCPVLLFFYFRKKKKETQQKTYAPLFEKKK